MQKCRRRSQRGDHTRLQNQHVEVAIIYLRHLCQWEITGCLAIEYQHDKRVATPIAIVRKDLDRNGVHFDKIDRTTNNVRRLAYGIFEQRRRVLRHVGK